MKLTKNIIIPLIGVLTIAGIGLIPKLTFADPANVLPVVHPDSQTKYDEHPAPRLLGNSTVASNKFISREQAIDKAI